MWVGCSGLKNIHHYCDKFDIFLDAFSMLMLQYEMFQWYGMALHMFIFKSLAICECLTMDIYNDTKEMFLLIPSFNNRLALALFEKSQNE